MSISTALEARRDALREREAGFTLIELLVVVIIIGILAAIAIPVYLGVQNNAKDSAVKSDLVNAKNAIVTVGTDNNGAIPASIDTTSKKADATVTGVTGTINLKSNGWSQSDNTKSLAYTLGSATTGTWCVVGASDSGKWFSISSTGQVKSETANSCTAA